jgi:hypothetical protein
MRRFTALQARQFGDAGAHAARDVPAIAVAAPQYAQQLSPDLNRQKGKAKASANFVGTRHAINRRKSQSRPKYASRILMLYNQDRVGEFANRPLQNKTGELNRLRGERAGNSAGLGRAL